MSDQIRRDFERLSGGTLSEPSFGPRRAFRALLALLLTLSLLALGFWGGMWVKLTLVPTVEAGTVVICDTNQGITAFTQPGYHFCPSGKWSSFRLHERVDFTTEVRLRDANVVQIKATLDYELPSDAEKLTAIYRAAPYQLDFNEGVVRSNGVRQLLLVFAQVDTTLLLTNDNLQRIGEVVADRTKADLQRNWGVTVRSFWFTGTGKIFHPEAFRNQSFDLTI